MKKSAVNKNGVMWVTVKKDVRNWSESLHNDVRNCWIMLFLRLIIKLLYTCIQQNTGKDCRQNTYIKLYVAKLSTGKWTRWEI